MKQTSLNILKSILLLSLSLTILNGCQNQQPHSSTTESTPTEPIVTVLFTTTDTCWLEHKLETHSARTGSHKAVGTGAGALVGYLITGGLGGAIIGGTIGHAASDGGVITTWQDTVTVQKCVKRKYWSNGTQETYIE